MKIKVTLGRQKVVENVGHDSDVLVRLLAPALPPKARRPALGVVLALDVSASMTGEKLEAVKRAGAVLIDHLCPGDFVGIVCFSDRARIVLPVTEVSERSRRALRDAVNALRPQGSTNLADGFLLGCRILNDAMLPRGLRKRLVLLTDGQANRGPATGREALRALVREHLGELSLSAFGYGADCEHEVLTELAEEGNGSFAYIRSEDLVLTAFARELGGLVGTYAADVRARVVPVAGAVIEERLGDLLYQAELSFHARLALPRHGAARGVEVARVEARYRDGSGEERTLSTPVLADYVREGEQDVDLDPDVCRARDEHALSRAQEAAEAHARSGDYAAARAALEAVLPSLASPELLAFVRRELLRSYESQQHYHSASALRASAKAALRKKRMLTSAEVPHSLEVRPTELERLMEASFHEEGRSPSAPRPTPGPSRRR